MATGDLWSLLRALREEALADPAIAGAPAPVREGVAFAYTLAHLPIGIPGGASLAGDLGWHWGTAEEQRRLQSICERQAAASAPPGDPSPQRLMHDWFGCHGSSGGDAHTTVDYERVVREGLAGIVDEVEREAAGAPEVKRHTLEGMRAALDGVIRWAGRYAELAEMQAGRVPEEDERARLLCLAGHCRRVPQLPSESFAEALQSIWLVHLAVGLSEFSGASLSLGRLDQYLLPLYQADLARGVPESDLEEALAGLFRALNTFFADPACAVNLGGAGPQGECLFNDLSRMILRVAKRLRLPAPLLAARIHESLAQADFDLLTDPALFEIGQPTFYGEEPCRETLVRRGVPAAEVHRWAINSCMGLMMPGEEWSNMWGSVVNCLLSLEMALNGGQPFHHELPICLPVEVPVSYTSFEGLFEAVCACTGALADFYLGETARQTERHGEAQPNPFVSALLADCIRRGQDRHLGGCRYQTVIVEAFGLVNASDALLALRRLVYEEGRYPLAGLVEAAKTNFEGQPGLLHALRAVPKYGSGDPEADAMARRLSDRFAQAVARHSRGTLCYVPSFHTLSAHIPTGARMGASLDGRLAGMPLAKNIGTTPGHCTAGHTALMQSAAAIDQRAFAGGQALDIWVDPGMLGTAEGRRKFQALLRGYFRLGGLQVQVNGVSVAVLRRALADPDSYRDILVRRAGYSTRFVDLPREEQVELVERFSAGV